MGAPTRRLWCGLVMVALGTGVQRVTGLLGRRLPVVTAMMLVVVGMWTLAARAGMDPAVLGRRLTHNSTNAVAGTVAVPSGESSKPCCSHDARR